MIRKLKITNITKYTKDKNGNPYKDKNGKPYIRVSVNAEGLEKPASTLVYRNTDPIYHWKEGDEVTAVVEYNGEYINIRAAGRLDLLEADVKTIKGRLERLENARQSAELDMGNDALPEAPDKEPDESINADDLPFN